MKENGMINKMYDINLILIRCTNSPDPFLCVPVRVYAFLCVPVIRNLLCSDFQSELSLLNNLTLNLLLNDRKYNQTYFPGRSKNRTRLLFLVTRQITWHVSWCSKWRLADIVTSFRILEGSFLIKTNVVIGGSRFEFTYILKKVDYSWSLQLSARRISCQFI